MANFDNYEQYLLELINRARLDPEAERERYNEAVANGSHTGQSATTLDDLNSGLAAGTISGETLQPLAPNGLLEVSSIGHSQHMLAVDKFAHSGIGNGTIGSRANADGYNFNWLGENLAWSGTTGTLDLLGAIENHHFGLFRSDGHRRNLMNEIYSEIGLARELGEFTSGLTYNASMLTQMFGHINGQMFITGVVYDDADNDAFYSIGEGSGSVGVSGAGTDTITTSTGGYEMMVSSGTHTVSIGSAQVEVAVSGQNVKLDLIDGNHISSSSDTTLISGASGLTLLGLEDLDANGTANGDTLLGNDGNNRLDGHGSNDILTGSAGDDEIFGGSGTDTVDYSKEDGSGLILVNLTAGTATDTHGDDDTLNSIEHVIGTSRADVIYGSVGNAVTLEGNGGDDELWGYFSLGDVLNGGDGVNLLAATGGSATIVGGNDTDYVLAAYGDNSINTSDGNDQVYVQFGTNMIDLGDGFNLLLSLDLFDPAASDAVGWSADTVTGGGADDYIYSGRGKDVINAGAGDDWIDGGGWNDTLTGGAGNDRFIFGDNSGFDVITDFTDGEDYLDFTTNTAVADFEDVAIIEVDGDVVMSWDSGTFGARLTDVSFADLSADDFLV